MSDPKYKYTKIFGGVRVENLDTGGEADVLENPSNSHEAVIAHSEGKFDTADIKEAAAEWYPSMEVTNGRK